jgi:hypothetical protein
MPKAATGAKGYSHPFKYTKGIMQIGGGRHQCQ